MDTYVAVDDMDDSRAVNCHAMPSVILFHAHMHTLCTIMSPSYKLEKTNLLEFFHISTVLETFCKNLSPNITNAVSTETT